MPIYEYECQACGHRLEVLQRLSEDPLTDCPACGQARLVRLVSAASFQLKGTGWYRTDFRDKGRKKPQASGEGEGSSGSAKEDAGGAKAASGG